MRKLTLGFSPCPNDTFIFDALVHHKIDTEGLEFDILLADVEALNQKAFRQELDITKLSYHAYAHLRQAYSLLTTGSALGNNCGPLLIAKPDFILDESTIPTIKIAIPGRFTTANFLLSLAFPNAQNRVEMLFSDIEEAVLDGTVQAGLIIHENRFTYTQKGLVKLMDLGEFWETQTKMPIPLGGIVVKRSLDAALQQTINRVLQRSVQFALAQPQQTLPYVQQYAQAMDTEVMLKHIGLYVNDFTVDLGERGKRAVAHLFEMAQNLGVIPKLDIGLTIDDV